MRLALDPIGELPSGTFLSINAAPDTVAGAGFASLRHVLRLAPDIIKIDSGVIGEIRSDRAARALTAALLSFANEMGEVVIAEGVEDDDTATVLRNLGVPYCQGFHFGEPTPTPGS
jgi:EAL domain-containing protein (putative c-di-GMP-specific phosphodiesterase class I)